MNIIFKGKPLKVVEEMKKEMIYQIKMIKLDDEEFETDEVENIQHNMNMYLEIINGIYQDLLIKDIKMYYDLEQSLHIAVKVYVRAEDRDRFLILGIDDLEDLRHDLNEDNIEEQEKWFEELN